MEKHLRLLEKLLDNQRVFVSTYDVEMFKWSFNRIAKRKLEFCDTEFSRMYIVKLKTN